MPLGLIGVVQSSTSISRLAFGLAGFAVVFGLLLWFGWRLWAHPTRRLIGFLVVLTVAGDVILLAQDQLPWRSVPLDPAVLVCCLLAWNHADVAGGGRSADPAATA
jgi:hypothetical protein